MTKLQKSNQNQIIGDRRYFLFPRFLVSYHSYLFSSEKLRKWKPKMETLKLDIYSYGNTDFGKKMKNFSLEA